MLERGFWKLPIISTLLSLYGASLYRGFYRFNSSLKTIAVPRSVHILLTMRCNSSCRHCEASAGIRSENELESKEVTQILSDLARLRTPRVVFTGGEPLLRDDIFELMATATELNLLVTLATNGLLVQNLEQELLQNPPDAVFTTIDGLEELHDHVRGVKGSFQKAIEGIRVFRKMGVKDVMVNTVVTDSNISSMDELGEKVFKAGASSWRLSPVIHVGRASHTEEFGLSQANMKKLVNFCAGHRMPGRLELNETCGGLGLVDREVRARPYFCGAGYKVCAVMETGEVVPCHVVYNKDFAVGNVREEAFPQLWKRCSGVVRQTALPQSCRVCPIYKGCLGGCWANRVNGNPCLKMAMEWQT